METAAAAVAHAAPSLSSLSEELLLELLQLLPSRQLCRVECLSRRFSRPSALAHADGERISLPERAAKACIEEAVHAGNARVYQRTSSETYKHVLLMLERGVLAKGVFHNMPVSAFSEESGWQLAYMAPYAHRTRDEHLAAVPPEARYVMLAACRLPWPVAVLSMTHDHALREQIQRDALTFSLLAWGRREVVLRETHGEHEFLGGETHSSNEEDGVHWYLWPSHAIGFSTDPRLFLFYADSAIARGLPEAASGDRLSWNLEVVSTGGWRAGAVTELGRSFVWLKCLYYKA